MVTDKERIIERPREKREEITPIVTAIVASDEESSETQMTTEENH